MVKKIKENNNHTHTHTHTHTFLYGPGQKKRFEKEMLGYHCVSGVSFLFSLFSSEGNSSYFLRTREIFLKNYFQEICHHVIIHRTNMDFELKHFDFDIPLCFLPVKNEGQALIHLVILICKMGRIKPYKE